MQTEDELPDDRRPEGERSGVLLAGRYRLTTHIAGGARAETWTARDEVLDREVLVKLLRGAGAEVAARFGREAVGAARLSHPGIVAVYDTITETDTLGLVLELVEATPLSRFLADGGSVSAAEATSIVLQVAEALEAAHQAGVAHLNLTPAAVWLCSDNRVKITDFGTVWAGSPGPDTAAAPAPQQAGGITPGGPATTGAAGGDPARGDAAGRDPMGVGAAGSDPARGDPTGSGAAVPDPTGGDPAGSAPTGSAPTGSAPTGVGAAGRDPTGVGAADPRPAEAQRADVYALGRLLQDLLARPKATEAVPDAVADFLATALAADPGGVSGGVSASAHGAAPGGSAASSPGGTADPPGGFATVGEARSRLEAVAHRATTGEVPTTSRDVRPAGSGSAPPVAGAVGAGGAAGAGGTVGAVGAAGAGGTGDAARAGGAGREAGPGETSGAGAGRHWTRSMTALFERRAAEGGGRRRRIRGRVVIVVGAGLAAVTMLVILLVVARQPDGTAPAPAADPPPGAAAGASADASPTPTPAPASEGATPADTEPAPSEPIAPPTAAPEPTAAAPPATGEAPEGTPAADEGPDEGPDTSTAAVVAVVDVRVVTYGAGLDAEPPGGGDADPTTAPAEAVDALRVLDGEDATFWATAGIDADAATVNGVGLAFELATPTALDALVVTSDTLGWTAAVHTAAVAGRSLEDWGVVFDQQSNRTGELTFDLAGTTAGAVLVWIPDPRAALTEEIRIAEVEILSAAGTPLR